MSADRRNYRLEDLLKYEILRTELFEGKKDKYPVAKILLITRVQKIETITVYLIFLTKLPVLFSVKKGSK